MKYHNRCGIIDNNGRAIKSTSRQARRHAEKLARKLAAKKKRGRE